jgi:hypothetical protein
MIELRSRLFASLLVLLAAAPQMSPQTSLSGPPASQAAVRKTGKAGNSRTSPSRNAITSPGLCFQPGVGWQRNFTGQPNPTSADASLLSAKQPHSAKCPGISTDKRELGGGVESLAILNPNPAIQSAGSAKPGALPSFRANPSLHPSGRAGLNSTAMTPSAMPSALTYSSGEAGPDKHSNQMGERAFHAYTSPIKLRRLIRSAPDFRTRMKLQQLENSQAPKSHHATVDSKTGQSPGKPLKGERVHPQHLRRNNAK